AKRGVMPRNKANLLIRYDEDEQKIRFYSVPQSSSVDSLSAKLPKPHLELDLATLRAKGSDEAERIAGSSVFVFFDFHSVTKTGIRDYAAVGKQFKRARLADTKLSAAKSDPEAQFELAMHHLDSSIRNQSRSDLDLAEKWLKTSADGGCKPAKDYLRD